MNLSDCSSSNVIFSVLNKKENVIELYFPKDNPRLFGSPFIYVDTFNDIIYLPLWIKKSFDFNISDCKDKTPRNKYIHRSVDQGKTWTEDKTTTELFDKYNFRKFEFLDKEHAMGYNRKKNSGKSAQGTYYLLKNMQVIDSLKTPDDIYYDNNYNNYGFSVTKDTIFLGRWIYYENPTLGKPYFQPVLTKIDEQWKFQVVEKIETGPVTKKQIVTDTKNEYQNFHLVKNRELVFKNGLGTLTLKSDVIETTFGTGYYVIEKGTQIYLIGLGQVYISFDGGASWNVYPLPLEYRTYSYPFLDFDEQGIISYFTDQRTENFMGISKVIYKFSPL